jgi:hypothetical protein
LAARVSYFYYGTSFRANSGFAAAGQHGQADPVFSGSVPGDAQPEAPPSIADLMEEARRQYRQGNGAVGTAEGQGEIAPTTLAAVVLTLPQTFIVIAQ